MTTYTVHPPMRAEVLAWIANAAPPQTPNEFDAYLAEHGRSFWMASRIVPEPHRSLLVGVYAFCRYTDDLVDNATCSRDELHHRVDEWEALARGAYTGCPTGVALLDTVMGTMAKRDVPFEYVQGLMNGMRADIDGVHFETREELESYCYNVASVVGLWLTELFGVHDRWTLDRAAKLGVAMQITNIVRDVGEDRRRGRLYIPQSTCAAFGITGDLIDDIQANDAPIPSRYGAALEDLMQMAEGYYAEAGEAIGNLPVFFRPAVMVASKVYRGIHGAIRKNNYDNIRRRAFVSDADKATMARTALASLTARA